MKNFPAAEHFLCAFPFHFFNRFVSTSCILSVRVFFSLLLLIFFLVLFWCRIVLIWLVRSFFNSPIDGCRVCFFFCTSLLFYFVVRMCTACTCVFAICRGRKFLVNCFTFVVAPSNIPMQYYESERPKTDNIFRCLYILGVYIARTKNSCKNYKYSSIHRYKHRTAKSNELHIFNIELYFLVYEPTKLSLSTQNTDGSTFNESVCAHIFHSFVLCGACAFLLAL